MVLKLRDAILATGGSERPLTRDEMVALARAVDLNTLECSEHKATNEKCYQRNRVLLNQHLELVCICWLPGQTSAVHDHGRSNCLYLVVDGEMTEELFAKGSNGKPESRGQRCFHRGEITVAAFDDIHRITNTGGENLTTIHIYSPPLDETAIQYTPIPPRSSVDGN